MFFFLNTDILNYYIFYSFILIPVHFKCYYASYISFHLSYLLLYPIHVKMISLVKYKKISDIYDVSSTIYQLLQFKDIFSY
jgi:hypothetical protein